MKCENIDKTKMSEMFSSIANKYDLLNHLLSFNVDKSWRKKIISFAAPNDNDYILDLCTGTGDIAIALAKHNSKCKIVGIDISDGMLTVGKKKVLNLKLNDRIEFLQGDAMELPFEDETFDTITIGFGLRNLPKQLDAISEMDRVLKKDGKLLILEFAPVQSGAFSLFYRFYLKFILPVIGWLISGSSFAYRYLSDSIFGYIKPEEIITILKQLRFSKFKSHALLGRIAYIYEAEK